MGEKAVYLNIDEVRTPVDAYNLFKKNLYSEFGNDISIIDDRLIADPGDPEIEGETAGQMMLSGQNVTAGLIGAHLNNRMGEDENDISIETQHGTVVINEFEVAPQSDVKNRVCEEGTQAVALKVDPEKTTIPAYNNLAKDIASEFENDDFSMGPPRKVYAADVSIADMVDPTANYVYFVVKEASSFAIYEYLRRQMGDDDDTTDDASEAAGTVNTVQTINGPVVIEEMNIMNVEKAKDATGENGDFDDEE